MASYSSEVIAEAMEAEKATIVKKNNFMLRNLN